MLIISLMRCWVCGLKKPAFPNITTNNKKVLMLIISMIGVILAVILLIISVIFLLLGTRIKESSKYTKIALLCYVYAIFFTFFAQVTHDPFEIPFIGTITPDAVFGAILAIGGGIVWKVYGFFDKIKKDISDIKDKLSQHMKGCEVKHEELDKRINYIKRK